MKQITKRLMLSSAIACAILGATNSWAQAWPNKPIRMVVPLAAGGDTDIASRVVATYLSEALGQQVIIENKLGANGVVGVDFASKLLLMVIRYWLVQPPPWPPIISCTRIQLLIL